MGGSLGRARPSRQEAGHWPWKYIRPLGCRMAVSVDKCFARRRISYNVGNFCQILQARTQCRLQLDKDIRSLRNLGAGQDPGGLLDSGRDSERVYPPKEETQRRQIHEVALSRMACVSGSAWRVSCFVLMKGKIER